MRLQQLMNPIARSLGLCLVGILAVSCMSTQSRYSMLDQSYPPKPEGYEVEIFQGTAPERPFLRISRLDVHVEKTHFIGTSLKAVLPKLKEQARLSGADAVIEIQESSSMVGESTVYHVTATGIRYTDTP